MKKMLFMFVVISLCGSSALALSPMGPPIPVERGQFIAGIDYSYSEMDIKMNHGTSPGGGPSMTMSALKRHYMLANLIYGVRENWELSFRVGGGAARDDEGGRTFKTASPTLGNGYVVGFGVKRTLIEDTDLKWGTLFQVLWAQADGRAKTSPSSSWDAEVEYVEVQIAVGPNYNLNDRVSIYGGPFFHILDGSFTAKRRVSPARIKYDLDEGSVFGGYIGTVINLTDRILYRFEYQHTAAADALGMSLLFLLN